MHSKLYTQPRQCYKKAYRAYSRSLKVGNPIASILTSNIGNPSTIWPWSGFQLYGVYYNISAAETLNSQRLSPKRKQKTAEALKQTSLPLDYKPAKSRRPDFENRLRV